MAYLESRVNFLSCKTRKLFFNKICLRFGIGKRAENEKINLQQRPCPSHRRVSRSEERPEKHKNVHSARNPLRNNENFKIRPVHDVRDIQIDEGQAEVPARDDGRSFRAETSNWDEMIYLVVLVRVLICLVLCFCDMSTNSDLEKYFNKIII